MKQIAEFIFPGITSSTPPESSVAAVRQEGAGGKYLIQHSAGSGKTSLRSPDSAFSSPTFTTPRTKAVLHGHRRVGPQCDRQPVAGWRSSFRTHARRCHHDQERKLGGKSGRLAQALAKVKKIIVCTIQTFPFALDAVLAAATATQGKRFAVIARRSAFIADRRGQRRSSRRCSSDELAAARRRRGQRGRHSPPRGSSRAGETGVTYGLHPRHRRTRTAEIFGHRLNPDEAGGTPRASRKAFHVYSMRQAIEEGFILDVEEELHALPTRLPPR